MKLMLLLFISAMGFSQNTQRQMISAQGGNASTTAGIVVKYTIGQQSVIGTKKGNVIIQQGYQQSNWKKISAANKVLVLTTTYPNPYVDIINFQFSQFIGDTVFLSVYDVMGRQVYSNTLQILENKTSVNLQALPRATYFVQLYTNRYKYFTQIIKN